MTDTEDLPTDWRIKKYGDIAKIIGGSTPSTDTDEYWGGDIQWAVPSEVTDRPQIELEDTERKITQKGLESGSINILPEKSVLMTSRATVGVPVINKVPMATNQGFQNFDLSDSNDIIAYYLYYQILENSDYIDSVASGGTFDEISKSELSKLRLGVPSLSEQRRIASVLYSVDEQVRSLHDRHDELTQLKHGLMQDLLTGNTRVTPDMQPRDEVVEVEDVDVGDTDSGVSDKQLSFNTYIPEDWKIDTMKEVSEDALRTLDDGDWVESDDMDDSGDYGLIQLGHIGSNNMKGSPNNFVNEDFIEEEDCMVLKENDLLISRMAEPIFRTCRVPRELAGKSITAVDIMRLCPNPSIHNNEYMKQVLNWHPIEKQASAWSGGTTRERISKTNSMKVKIPVPPLWEQERIASILYTVDEMIARTSELIDEYERLKRGLMQDLLSGNIRTPEDLEVLEEVMTEN